MKFSTSTIVAAALCAVTTNASAQSGRAADAARQDAVVRQALSTYNIGLAALDPDPSPWAGQPGVDTGGIRELTLDSAVALALEKNLPLLGVMPCSWPHSSPQHLSLVVAPAHRPGKLERTGARRIARTRRHRGRNPHHHPAPAPPRRCPLPALPPLRPPLLCPSPL